MWKDHPVHSLVVLPQCSSGRQIRQQQIQGEVMLPHLIVPEYLHNIKDNHRQGHNDRLTSLQSIDPSQDVNGISAEHRQHTHEDVVEESNVQ